MRALQTAATGMVANQFHLDVIANNLANVNTSGFKRSAVSFSDLLYQNLRSPGATVPSGSTVPTMSQVGLGVAPGVTHLLFTQGTILNTGNDTDVAIQGDGFLKVLTPNGAAYTRHGRLVIDSTGKLVTPDGYPLEPEIIVPKERISLSIGADGTVLVQLPNQTNAQELGKITLTRFLDPASLLKIGGNLYIPSAASGDPTDETPGVNGTGTLLHKALEQSNVEVVEELIQMITVQRAYETNSKVIQTSDEMLQQANNIKR